MITPGILTGDRLGRFDGQPRLPTASCTREGHDRVVRDELLDRPQLVRAPDEGRGWCDSERDRRDQQWWEVGLDGIREDLREPHRCETLQAVFAQVTQLEGTQQRRRARRDEDLPRMRCTGGARSPVDDLTVVVAVLGASDTGAQPHADAQP